MHEPILVGAVAYDPKVVAKAFGEGARDYWVKASFKFEELPQRLAPHLPTGPAAGGAMGSGDPDEAGGKH